MKTTGALWKEFYNDEAFWEGVGVGAAATGAGSGTGAGAGVATGGVGAAAIGGETCSSNASASRGGANEAGGGATGGSGAASGSFSSRIWSRVGSSSSRAAGAGIGARRGAGASPSLMTRLIEARMSSIDGSRGVCMAADMSYRAGGVTPAGCSCGFTVEVDTATGRRFSDQSLQSPATRR